MELKDIIRIHKERLDTLDPKKDYNNFLWYIGVAILLWGLVFGYLYSIGFVFLGFLGYSIFAYKSVKWNFRK